MQAKVRAMSPGMFREHSGDGRAAGSQAAERSTPHAAGSTGGRRVGRRMGCLHLRQGAAWTFVGTGEAGFAGRGFENLGTRGK